MDIKTRSEILYKNLRDIKDDNDVKLKENIEEEIALIAED